jgi:UTP--glucose-1-phosphate uridylyltransferase
VTGFDRGVDNEPLAPWLAQDGLELVRKVDQVLKKAVIPAAGLGRRMSSLTGGAPKEMLPLAGRPIIHHVVQEAIDAGIVEICIVIHKSKGEIRRYFESDNREACEAERTPEKLRSKCNIVFAYQEEPTGLGDAVLCAKAFVGDERFALLIPDQLFIGRTGAIRQLGSKNLPPTAVVSSLTRIPALELEYFPGARRFICESYAGQSGVMAVTGIEPADHPSSSAPALRGFGRTIFPPEVFEFLDARFADVRTREVDLLKTFRALLAVVPSYGVLLEGEAFDLGTVEGYRYFHGRFAASGS